MIKRYTFLFLSLLTATIAVAAGVESDSLDAAVDTLSRGVNLNEVVVKARGASVVKDGISYLPSKTVRKVAMDPTDMLRRMPISNIKVEGSSVTNLYNDEVVFFLNGVEATRLDVEALLPKDVKRVLVLENPSDPKYKSKKFVVDFITDPPYGGYVFVNPSYSFFLNKGRYDVLGKLVSGNSTFQMKGNFRYGDSKGGYSTQLEHYDLTDIKSGQTLDLTRKTSVSDMRRIERSWDVIAEWAFNASTDERHVVNVEYQQNQNPITANRGMVEDEWIYSRSNSDNKNFGAKYSYNRFFSNGSFLNARALFRYSKTGGHSSYERENYPLILNAHDENAYSWMISAYYSIPLHHDNSFAVDISASNRYYNVHYAGTANQINHIRDGHYDIFLCYNHAFTFGSNRLNLSFDTEFPLIELKQDGGKKMVSVGYNSNLNMNATLGSSHTLGFRFSGQRLGRNISTFSGVTIQQTELLGKTGNDGIAPEHLYSLQAVYTWLATRELNLSLSGYFSHTMDVLCSRYFLSDGIIYTQNVNSGVSSVGGFSGSATVRFFNDAFMAKVGGVVYKYYANGLFNYDTWVATPYVQLNYMHPKGFSAMIYYRPPTGSIPESLIKTRDLTHRLYLNAGFSTGNLNVMVYCEPLNKYIHKRNYIHRPGVNIIDDNHSQLDRYFNITLKYVFDFGKRQQHNMSIGGSAANVSSM